jgi:hypothetical protein
MTTRQARGAVEDQNASESADSRGLGTMIAESVASGNPTVLGVIRYDKFAAAMLARGGRIEPEARERQPLPKIGAAFAETESLSTPYMGQ